MFRRRTRARLELFVSILTLHITIYIWKYLLNDEETRDEPLPVSPAGLAIGALSGAAFRWAHDCDVGNMRTSRRHRVLAGLVRTGWKTILRLVVSKSDTFQYSFDFGTLIGTIIYRLWYGLLHPLPGDD